MTRHHYLAFAAGIGLTALATGAQEANMLKNGRFAEWEGGSPVGWELKFNRTEIAPGLDAKRGAGR